MGFKSILAKPFAFFIAGKVRRESAKAVQHQKRILKNLVKKARFTRFGRDHHFDDIHNHLQFTEKVPVTDYEGLRPYIERALHGEEHVLWPGKPLYWSKTSGTTSGIKYIPITRDSIPFHIRSARNALLCYIAETGNASFVDGKLIFLSGSPELEEKNGIPAGRLSGIVNHHVPAYLRTNQLPSYPTNCIDDWEKKVDRIVDETMHQPMTLISGIPPWVQMYFDKLQLRSGKTVGNLFPHFSLFVYGGVNLEPYRTRLEAAIGRKVDTLETYPASEGFIAFQDTRSEPGLLLLTNNGIFFEFIPVETYYDPKPVRLSLQDVELERNYAMVLSTNAGLFGYSIGDTVKFVSLNPWRIVVTGRISHFISAFGEHVIGEEVEYALLSVAGERGIAITEFTVAPQVNPESGLPYHEWFVEFVHPPDTMEDFELAVDSKMQDKNIYYRDLRDGNILRALRIHSMPAGSFVDYMRSQGKLGGQNKVPRLSNDRRIADALSKYIV